MKYNVLHVVFVAESNTGNVTGLTDVDWAALSNSECIQLNGVMVGSDSCDGVSYTADVFMLSCLLFLGTFIIAMSLKFFRNTRFFPNMVTVIIFECIIVVKVV